MTTKFTTEVLPRVKVSSSNEVLVYFVDQTCLRAGAETLFDMELNARFIDAMQLPQDAPTVLKTLITLQKLVHNPTDGSRLINVYLAEIALDEKKAKKKPPKMEPFVCTDDGYVGLVQQYVERVYGENDEFLGFNIFYVAMDSQFSFDVALESLFKEETEKKEREKAKRFKMPPGVNERAYDPYCNKSEWIHEGISMYTKEEFNGTKNACNAMGMKLSDPYNPAKAVSIFNIERAIEWSGRNVERTKGQYVRSLNVTEQQPRDGALAPITTTRQDRYWIFSRPAFYVHPQYASPRLFFNMKIKDMMQQYAVVNEDYLQSRITKRNILSNVSATDVFIHAKKIIKAKKEQNPAGFGEWIREPDTVHLIQNALASDHFCPLTVKAFGWVQDQRRDAMEKNNEVFSCVDPITRFSNDSWTFLANCLQHDLDKTELMMGILSLHSELLMLLKTALLSGDIDSPVDARMHVVFSGIPASGKSHILKVLQKMTMEGVADYTSYVSGKGDTTSKNSNGLINLMDELLGTHTGSNKDNSSLARIKEAMSRGIIRTKTCYIHPETGERIEQITETYDKSLIFAATNDAFYRMDPAIGSRVAHYMVPDRKRKGRDPSTENYAIRDDIDLCANSGEFVLMWKKRQMIAAIICAYVRMGVFPPIDTGMVQSMVQVVNPMLEEEGYLIDSRNIDRVFLHVQSVCIYDAINRVFFTDDYFAKGTEFQFEQIYECAAHLCCTREHFWVALGEMFPTLVNPLADTVLETLVSLVFEQKGNDRFSGGLVSSSVVHRVYLH